MTDKIIAKFKEFSTIMKELSETDNWYSQELGILTKKYTEPTSNMKPSEFYVAKHTLDSVALNLILKMSE